MAVGKRGKYFHMYFTFQGQRVQKSTRCTNKREAEEIERAYRTQLAKGEVGLGTKKRIPKFEEAVADYLAWSAVEHREKPNTHDAYVNSTKALKLFFGNCRIDKINPKKVEDYKAWRANQPLRTIKKKNGKKKTISNGTINRELACLRLIINHQIKNELLTSNPVSKVKMLSENLNRWRVISKSEEKKYLFAASQPLEDIATLMLNTGCRQGELFKLRKEDVDLERATIEIKKGKTPSARRKIPLTDTALKILTRRFNIVDSDWLFVNEQTGEPITNVKSAHRGALKRSGLDHFRLYDLRHTFASRFVECGGDLITLKDILGHSNLDMVLKYSHPSEEHRREAIRKLG
ncbi:MAG: site-specific integrase [Acidobacteria bacterium]|nr:MAG: site-specific integrase [Acidobacteriota bacterium]REK02346.1 MAG: site-specific integrase [Acidobacteriota bacterium]REK13852.1 MAG: site-specific integrase [Acidobacteriota bacterium]REK41847.1 MAG: site-specific integrase [Acidobacteriota bacterium]